MQTPLFSIVIPTKNRPTLLDDAIRSCLLQRFDNYEVIVSDNHNDQLTLDVLKRYQDYPNVRVVKPEQELNMLDHWEFATKNATGHYVIVLTDRSVLCQNALMILQTFITKNPSNNCFAFGTKSYSEIDQKFNTRNTTGPTRTFQGIELIENFKEKLLYSPESYDYYFPKSINSCFKNVFANSIRAKHGHYFNTPGVSTPDYSSFFINGLTNKTTINIGKTLMMSQGTQYSNGGNFSKGDNSYLKTLQKSFSLDHSVSKLPLIYNLVYNDFKIVCTHLKENEQLSDVVLTSYFSNLFHELEIKKTAGISDDYIRDLENELKKEMLNLAFKESQILALQMAVKTKYARFHSRSRKLRLNWRIHLQDFLYARFSEKSLLNKIYPFHYSSILEAAGFKTI